MRLRYVVVVFLCTAAGCAASTKSSAARTGADDDSSSSLIDENAENEDNAVIARSRCLGDENKPKQCESDNDCCPGYYCGRDPQVSDVIKICMSGGE